MTDAPIEPDTLEMVFPAGREPGGSQGDPLDDEALADAYPWPTDQTWVRAMMVTTLDGAAVGDAGVSKSLSSPADKRVMGAVRRFCDVVLIGAQTMRAEKYSPLRSTPDDMRRREELGLRRAPTLAVVSSSLDLPFDLPVWSESTQRPIVLTPTTDTALLADAQQHADVVTLSDGSPAAMISALEARGLRRIVCEGGPRLLHTMLAAGLVDEADMTFAPLMSGDDDSPRTPKFASARTARLIQVLRGGDHLMNRYLMGE